jgi:hypothetical protein
MIANPPGRLPGANPPGRLAEDFLMTHPHLSSLDALFPTSRRSNSCVPT